MSDVPFRIALTEGAAHPPWRVMVYGVPGVGKSTFAANAPSPLFLDLENGLARVNCKKTQLLRNLEEVMAGLRFAYSNLCETVVVDSISKLEEYLTAEVCKKNRVSVLGDIPWGKGPDFLVAEWAKVLEIFTKIQDAGKNILLLGHDQVLDYLDPMSENYQRYAPRLNKKTLPLLVQEMDAVLFAHWEKFVKSRDSGKGRIAVGTGSRLLRAQEDPSAIAKNRFNLEEVIPMDAALFNRMN